MHEFMREFAHEFVDEFFANFVHEFKYEIRTNSYELFARKIGYVTNGLYCRILKGMGLWGISGLQFGLLT